MKIIVIDDGVNIAITKIDKLLVDLEVSESLELVNRVDSCNSDLSHGSICAAIIKKYAPDCEIGSIKVLDEQLYMGTIEQLVVALKWCLNHQVKLIHMSIGITVVNHFEMLKEIVDQLLATGCCIVAANSNNGLFTLPAGLSSVIGVATEKSYEENYYEVNSNRYVGIDFVASSRHLLELKSENFITKNANSYAAPFVTSMAYQIIKQNGILQPGLLKYKLAVDSGSQEPCNVLETIRLDYINFAIVVSEEEILWNFCLFREVKKCDFKTLELLTVKKSVTLVVISKENNINENNKMVVNFLLRNKENILGVVYTDIMPRAVKEVCQEKIHCFWWDESINEKYYPNMVDIDDKLQVPIIEIMGEGEELFRFADALKIYFLNQGYAVWGISDLKYSYLYHLDYFSKGNIQEGLFSFYEKKYNLDIILYVSGKVNCDFIDLKVQLQNQGINIIDAREKVIQSCKYGKNYIRSIYNTIVLYFDSDEDE